MAEPAIEMVCEIGAPRDLVWRAYTESEHLAIWWPGPGPAWGGCRMQFQPGGMFHFLLLPSQGGELWQRWLYLKIEWPDRIVFISSFSDDTGGVTRSPLNPSWPLGVMTTLTFSENKDRTRLELKMHPVNASAEECGVFSRLARETGFIWESAHQRLSVYLDKLKQGGF